MCSSQFAPAEFTFTTLNVAREARHSVPAVCSLVGLPFSCQCSLQLSVLSVFTSVVSVLCAVEY